LFNLGKKLVNATFGLTWVLFYAGSMLPFFYFKSGIIDPWFNLFIFLGIYFQYLYLIGKTGSIKLAAGSAFFIGLAILTKGPVALLVYALTAGIFIVLKRFRVVIRKRDVAVFALVLSITGGFWFILQILNGNISIIADFILYQIRLFKTQDAGHGGFLLYHFVILFFGVFPASVFALPVLFRSSENEGPEKDFYLWMVILFWVVLLLFTLVRTKIVHYSSLCYFPLTFLAAWSCYHARSFNSFWKPLTLWLTIAIGTLLGIIVLSLTFIDSYKTLLIEHNLLADPFARACLMADGGWKGYEFLAGLAVMAGVIGFVAAWQKSKHDLAVKILTGTFPLFMTVAMILIVPHVEAYSQRAAIEFFSSVSNEDAYLETVGYKSYAHLFYGKVKKHTPDHYRDEKWLLTGQIDKDAYFAIKIHRKEKFIQDYPDMHLLYEKNGFVFFKRTPNSTP
jgi:hypothetical protein